MLKKSVFIIFLFLLSFISINAQTADKMTDTVMILPFENTSAKPEFNWVGESCADSLADLLDGKGLNVISNQERKILQQSLNIPLSVLPSMATSLNIAKKAKATLLVVGKYNILPAQDGASASVNVTAKVIRVNEGRVLSEDFPDGRRIEFTITDALGNLQTIQGQLAYVILLRIDKVLYKLDKSFPFAENDFKSAANKVPARAFEAYIKGLLTSETDAQTRENFLKNAMRLYAEAKSGETYPDAALELGHLYLNQHKNNDAVDYFGRVVNTITECRDKKKSESKPLQCKEESYAEASFYIGLIQWQQNNYEQALEVLRPLTEDLKLSSVYATIGAITVESSRAVKKDKGKSAALLKEGLELLKRAVESVPEDINAKYNYGVGLFLNGNYADADAQLRPVVASNPRDGESYYLLAKAREQLKDPTASDLNNQAILYLKENNKYAKLQTEWRDSQSINGVTLRIQQPLRKDFASFVLVKKQPTNVQTPLSEVETLLAQTRTLYKNGNDDEAMIVLQRITASEPMKAEAYFLRGMIYLRRGNMDESVAQLRTALFWDNRLINAHVALGKIYLQKGDCLQAKNYTASATAIDGENQDAIGLGRQVERCGK